MSSFIIYSLVFAIGAFQAFVFSFLLLTKKPKNRADKFLSAFFFIVALYFFNIFSGAFHLWEKFPDLVFLISLVALSFGPLLYFYVISLLGKDITLRVVWIHVVPILGVFILIFPYLFLSEDVKMLYFTDKFNVLPLNISIAIFLQYLSAPVYFIWVISILRKYNKELKNTYSSVEGLSLDWIRKLLYGAIIMWTIDSLNVYALNYTNIDYPYIVSFYIKVVFMMFIILIGYNGIKQGGVFTVSKMNSEKESNEIVTKSEKSKLISDEQLKLNLNKLYNYMQDEQAFFNNELRIQDVAQKLDISSHILSYIINNGLNQNFYDFVNQYRIKEVKRRLNDSTYNNLTIVAIAYDCGFNSKSTFNRLFKQFTGQTPTQFRTLSNS